MKQIKLFISLLLVTALAAVSCKKASESYTPGEEDLEGCYGVYFPTQAVSEAVTLDPEAEKAYEITVARLNTEGEITVPVEILFDDDHVFSLSPVHFDDGQAETTCTLSFPNASSSVAYSPVLEIQKKEYASIYDEYPAFLRISSLMIVTWEYVMDETGSEMSTVTFYDAQNGETVTCNIQYYEVDGTRYCHTINEEREYGQYSWGKDGGFWGTGADKHLSFYWYPEMSVYDGYQAIELPLNIVTDNYVEEGTSYGEVEACDYYHYYTDLKGNSLGTYSDFYSKYGGSYQLGYYDGNGGFYLYVVYPINTTGYWFGAHWLNGVASGYTRVDYSISAEAGLTENGAVPVTFTVGADVAKVKYVVSEGALGDSEIEKLVESIASDSNAVDVDTNGESSVSVSLSNLGATGTYTLVAVSVDASGNVQESCSTTFNYVASGDSVPVDISGGIFNPEDKYVPQGYTSEQTLEFYVYGSDITEAKVGVFTYANFVADSAACAEALIEQDALAASDVAEINGNGYRSIFTGLMPGTEYYLLVYASNGYEDTVINAGSAWTTGDPLPIYAEYSYSDYNTDYVLSSEDDLFGTYNLYAVDGYGASTLRSYIGKAVLSDSATEDEGPDDNGYYDEYIDATGFSGGAIDDDTILLDCYAGYLYIASIAMDGHSNYWFVSSSGSGYGSGNTYLIYGIPVLEGYYAFVTPSNYTNYGFDGIFFYSDKACYYDYLLVDPKVDDNGVAPAALNARINAAKKALSKFTIGGKINTVDQKEIAKVVNKAMDEAVAPAGKIVKGFKVEGPAAKTVKVNASVSNTKKHQIKKAATL